VSFKGYHDPEKAGELRNQLVFVRADDRPPLPKGEYYHHQLLGLRVISDTGEELGVLKDILETGANDVYLVARSAAEDILLPAIADVVLAIDLERGEMQVRLLSGLLPDEG
jgi:16S rRNA processing protein RimM